MIYALDSLVSNRGPDPQKAPINTWMNFVPLAEHTAYEPRSKHISFPDQLLREGEVPDVCWGALLPLPLTKPDCSPGGG